MIDLERSVENYKTRYGEYEEMPVLERAVYTRLQNMVIFYKTERDKIIEIFRGKRLSKIMPQLCEDTSQDIVKYEKEKIMLYQLFPETILDFCIEYLLFRNSVLQLSLSDQLMSSQIFCIFYG